MKYDSFYAKSSNGKFNRKIKAFAGLEFQLQRFDLHFNGFYIIMLPLL